MNPWRLMAILEASDPSFKRLLFPAHLRCRLDPRVVRAIEGHWPAYFPTRKECRGPTWSFSIREDEPLYKPHPGAIAELDAWKSKIKGTLAEGRAYHADTSWRRFFEICKNYPSLRPFLKDFKPVADFLIREESMWPRYDGMPVAMEDGFRDEMKALLAPNSPYHFADPERLSYVQSSEPTSQKINMIHLMRQLYDRPLMVLAFLQSCMSKSSHSRFCLPIRNHVAAIIKTPSPVTFRKTWLEHAMQVSGAKAKSGKSVPRRWAKKLLAEKDQVLSMINAKAVEVHYWRRGKKRPSLRNIRRAGEVVYSNSQLNGDQAEAGKDLWLFSWMVTLWLEKHCTEIAAEFKSDKRTIRDYYGRFFHYLEVAQTAGNSEEAGGFFVRQP
jgi:hypothetical protein